MRGRYITDDSTIRLATLCQRKKRKKKEKENRNREEKEKKDPEKRVERRERKIIREDYLCVQILVGVRVQVSFDRYSQDLAYTFICINEVNRGVCQAESAQ